MTVENSRSTNSSRSTARFWREYARALAGALLFSLPLLMTMEMWWLGFYLAPYRLLLFIVVLVPVLIGLSRYSGFRETNSWYEDTIDALVALTAGFLVPAITLSLFSVVTVGMSLNEVIGKTAILAAPASMGAVIASKEFGRTENRRERERAGYGGELFIMSAGAMFFAFNVAPTEEMILIAYKMGTLQSLLLLLVSLLIMHMLVYSLEFRGQHSAAEGSSPLRVMLHFTVAGYAITLVISAYVLWTFGRFDGLALGETIATTSVLGFPAALGAGTARLVV